MKRNFKNDAIKMISIMSGIAVACGGYLLLHSYIADPGAQLPSVPGASINPAAAVEIAPYSFAAAGDFGANTFSNATLNKIGDDTTSFTLALGDLDYDQTSSDAAFCTYVKDRVGSTYPFQIVTGNHEQQGGPDGYILNHAACLPNRMTSTTTGTYPVEYYFDYPAASPNLRVIMISPDLVVNNITYNYTSGNTYYNRLGTWIDQAKASGKWVVVGMHKNCITTGSKTCEIGTALQNLLVNKKVDLIFQGHDHTYQRSKQLALGTGCSGIPTNTYDADCVVDTGSDGQYTKGKGPVLVINGIAGRCCYDVAWADSESGYFTKIHGYPGAGFAGYSKVSVLADRLNVSFVNSSTTNTISDSFSIIGTAPTPPPPPPPPPAPTADLNGDRIVNILDLSVLLSNWNKTGTGLKGDINGDNVVNVLDLSALLSKWGTAG
jgi:hypothetical protein